MSEIGTPYTIYTRNRPTRLAFLIDLEVFPDRTDQLNNLIDEIVDYNNTHWGGRTNPIICFRGKELTSDDWRFLELSDPDGILVFAPLPPQLLESLSERLSPWSIELDDRSKDHAQRIKLPFELSGIPTPPTPAKLTRLRKLGSSLFDRNEKLLMFEFSDDCEPDVKRFAHRNFGTFQQWIDPNSQGRKVRRIGWLERILPKIQTHIISISDRASMAAALTEMVGRILPPNPRPAIPFIAPCQLASIGLKPIWTPSEYQHVYQVIVGDSATDFVRFWDDVSFSKSWPRPYTSQLWLPSSLLTDSLFLEALRDWLRAYTGHGNNDRQLELISNSIPIAELEKIREFFSSARPPIYTRSSGPDLSEGRRRSAWAKLNGPGHFVPWDSGTDAIRFTGIAKIESLSIPKPEPLEDEYNISGNWMVDIQVEHVPKTKTSGREHSWWTLPWRNTGGLIRAMFRAPVRINKDGRFSVSVGTENFSPTSIKKPEIMLSLPDDFNSVQWLLRNPYGHPFLLSDLRSDSAKRQIPLITSSRISEKGANLNGMIGLLGSFWTAKSFCESRFWREILSRMAGNRRGGDEKLHSRVRDLIQAEAFGSEEEVQEKSNALASKFLHLVRGRLKGQHITLRDMQKLRSELEKKTIEPQSFIQGNAIINYHGMKALSSEDMHRGLNQLLELGMFRLGIEDLCPNCQTTAWCHVDDLKQLSTCRGCGYTHSLRATEEWTYALNTLAQTSVSQGIMGVLHALVALASYARNFFVFSPSLELFRDNGSQPWREIDVLAILDGDFVIGEVKEGYVHKTTFDEMAEVAELLRPQRAVIFLPASHAQKQSTELKTWLSEMRTRLAPRNISAELFILPEF